MLLSVIIPVYNVRDYLTGCLDSVIAATRRLADANIVADDAVEAIFIDDGSSDGSGDVLDAFATRADLPKHLTIRVLHQPNGGVSVARNAGIETATGTWVAFLDADDTWHEDLLTHEFTEISKHPEADLAIFSIRCVNEDGCPVNVSTCPVSRVMSGDELLGNDAGAYSRYICSASDKLFRLSVIKTNSLRFKPGMRISEDSLFAQTFLCHATTVIVDSGYEGYDYLMRGTSASHNKKSQVSFHDEIFFKELYPRWCNTKADGLTKRLTHIALGCFMLARNTSEDNRRTTSHHMVHSETFNRLVVPFLVHYGRTAKARWAARCYLLSPTFLRQKILEKI